MTAWFRAVYDLGVGMALMLVAFDVGAIAGRLHGRLARRPRVGAVLTPLVLRATCAGLGAIGVAVGAVRLVAWYRVTA
ncbi:hypothetical protein ABZZ36_29680 [Actinacidiphila glaucinigra]|uniref:hypothetical protein n=1 Tax=Actinacidiphila glaucinigra TaxID=235986 RepID=UPI0033AB96F3